MAKCEECGAEVTEDELFIVDADTEDESEFCDRCAPMVDCSVCGYLKYVNSSASVGDGVCDDCAEEEEEE